MSTPWDNNGFTQSSFGQSFKPFSSGTTAGAGRGRPIATDRTSSLAPQQPNQLADSNPFLANPNSRPLGDPQRRQARLDARNQPDQNESMTALMAFMQANPQFQAFFQQK